MAPQHQDMKVTTSSLLTQVAKFGDEMNVIKCLLWPIFLVGAESDVEADASASGEIPFGIGASFGRALTAKDDRLTLQEDHQK